MPPTLEGGQGEQAASRGGRGEADMRNLHAFELRFVAGAGWGDLVRGRIRHNDGYRTRTLPGEAQADPAATAAPKPQPLIGYRGARDHF
jgi:hypothetical protein